MKKKKSKIDQKINRELAKEVGFYDGRYRVKIVPDQKKKRSKDLCDEKIETDLFF